VTIFASNSDKTDARLFEKLSVKVISLQLAGANRKPVITQEDELPAKSNYFIGNDPTKWRTNISNYGRVRYGEIYPGIDLVYYGNQGQLEHDFVVAPGADPSRIKLRLRGVHGLRRQIATFRRHLDKTDACFCKTHRQNFPIESSRGNVNVGWYPTPRGASWDGEASDGEDHR
jgi:hypothetical protein